MGAFVAYNIYTSIVIVALYLAYKLTLAGEKQPGVNRAVINGILVAAFAVWPLAELDWWVAKDSVGTGVVEVDLLSAVAVEAGATEDVPLWPWVLGVIYFGGVAVCLSTTLMQYGRLWRMLRRGEGFDYDGARVVVTDDPKVAPFSWGRYVVMNRADYDEAFAEISAHELAHIGRRHTLDLTLAQVVCMLQWFNPAAWLLRSELATVHEFQADSDVLAGGMDPRSYQLLLIKKAVGSRFQSLANSLNHSNLKKRITMMYKKESSGWSRVRVLSLVPALVVAVAMTNVPLVADAISLVGESSMVLSSSAEVPVGSTAEAKKQVKVTKNPNAGNAKVQNLAGKVISIKKSGDSIASVAVQKRPEFPGGEQALMSFLGWNVRYPAEAVRDGVEGVSVVKFAVGADGKVSDPQVVRSAGEVLDAEAVRVVSAMPNWIPAEKDGKKVATWFTLPVKFAIPKKDKGGETKATVVMPDGKSMSSEEVPVFVDGVLFTKKINELKSSEIKSMTVKKDDPAYPNGAIYITTK